MKSEKRNSIVSQSMNMEGQFDIAKALHRLNGDWELLCELIQIFIEDSPKMLRDLQTAINNKDLEQLSRVAHALKGMASNFSNSPVEQLAFQIELSGKQQTLDGVERRLAELTKAANSLSTDLAAIAQSR